MKETLGAALCIMAIALLFLGDQSFSRYPVAEEVITPQVSDTASEPAVHTDESTSAEQNSNKSASELSVSDDSKPTFDLQSILPDSLFWDSENETIKYVTPDTSIRVYFPDMFCYVQTDKPSDDGICLATQDGTAALMIGTMTAANMTSGRLVEYLKAEYPDSTVYLTDSKDVVCIYDTIDASGTAWTYFLCVRIRADGYFEVAIMCPTVQKDRYTNIFSRIEIANLYQ